MNFNLSVPHAMKSIKAFQVLELKPQTTIRVFQKTRYQKEFF